MARRPSGRTRKQKRVGVLTSGGDCSGLNAVIRAVVYRAKLTYGWKVFGIHEGTLGLMNRPLRYEELEPDQFAGHMLRVGGTMLGTTNKGDPFAFPMPDGSIKDRSGEFVEGYRMLGLDALIGIGGDGSHRLLSRLCQADDVNFVAIPKTIDNDVAFTEFSVGFMTAADLAMEALDRLLSTAVSHHRIMVLEVMGRDAGHIALNAGIAGGADIILIPEIPYSLAGVFDALESAKKKGRNHGLVIVAEGVKTEEGDTPTVAHRSGAATYGGIGQYLGERIAERTGADVRTVNLGHVQRGGAPVMLDRVVAQAFGVRAVDLVAAGRFDRMVAWQHREVVDVPLEEVVTRSRKVLVHGTLVHTARGLGTYVGDVPETEI